ncbi:MULTISPECIES: hypothetical protein [unclassified Streptomyces]|uniref:hypothetical protein n=1 Tax=unclassified Streptomyces TaxID=2593676 RepID=UPI00278BB4BF|nr:MULTISPECIES: hypothetical protein [unclassified Streptomyces]
MTTTTAPATTRPAPRPFRTELRRGFAPWAGLAFTLALGWVLVAKSSEWQGDWSETTDLVRGAGVVVGGSLALGAGCWQGGRERRRGTGELRVSAARSPLARHAATALPLVVWLLAGYALAAAGALLATWPYAYGDSVLPTALVGAAGTIAACALLGHVVGATVRWRLAPPLLALAGYGLFGFLQYAPELDLPRLLGPAPGYAPARELLVWWHPLLTATWYLALAATATLAYAARRRWVALLPALVALAAAVTLTATGDSMTRPNPRYHQQVCDTSTTPQICVNATYARLLPATTRALRPLTDKLKGVRNLPTRFEDLPGRPGPGEAALPMISYGWTVERGRFLDPAHYRWEAREALGGYDCPSLPEDTVTDDAVMRWLTPVSHQARTDRDSARGDHRQAVRIKAEKAGAARLAAMAPAERRAWLSRYFAYFRHCDRTAQEAPKL